MKETIQRLPPDVADTAYRAKRLATRKLSRAATKKNARNRVPIGKNYESALACAARRSGLTKGRATLFMSCLVEEITDRLLLGQYIRIPRLVFMCITPSAAYAKFRVRYATDSALRLRMYDEVNIPSSEDLNVFLKTVRSLKCVVPSYKRRKSSWGKLLAFDRRAAYKDAAAELDPIDVGLVNIKEVPHGYGQE